MFNVWENLDRMTKDNICCLKRFEYDYIPQTQCGNDRVYLHVWRKAKHWWQSDKLVYTEMLK